MVKRITEADLEKAPVAKSKTKKRKSINRGSRKLNQIFVNNIKAMVKSKLSTTNIPGE